MAAHQAGGSCHKAPSGASTRAGLNGPKIVKNRRWLASGSVKCGQTPGNFQGSSWETVEASGSQHLGPASAASNRDHAVALGAIAAKLRKTQYGRVTALRVVRRPAQFRQFRQTDDDGRSRQGIRKGRSGCEGFTTRPAEAGVARESEAAKIPGPWPHRSPIFRKCRNLPR